MRKFQLEVNSILDSLLNKFYAEIPYAKHLFSESEINIKYYTRHTIETILRIRLARIADAKLLTVLTRTDPLAAKKWADYTQDEMLHDLLFLSDLEKINIKKDRVYGTSPFFSTRLLQGFLYYTIEHESPRGLLSKAYFLEYMSTKTQPLWIKNIGKSLGEELQKGAKTHVSIDDKEEHSQFVWSVLSSQVSSNEERLEVIDYFKMYHALFSAYFNELYEFAINKRRHFAFDVSFD